MHIMLLLTYPAAELLAPAPIWLPMPKPDVIK